MRSFLIFLVAATFTSWALAGARVCQNALSVADKKEIEQRLALAAGLHMGSPHFPGYTRQGSLQDGFTYWEPNGKQVVDPVVVSRLQALGLPPAWKNVWIAVDPLSHLQATGVDDAQRTQYRYHPIWESEVKDVAKYERMQKFGEALPRLRRAVKEDLEGKAIGADSRKAAVVRLLEISGIRIGGLEYATKNDHYGLVSMQVQHIKKIDDREFTLVFEGKMGKERTVTIQDPDVVRIVHQLIRDKAPQDSIFDLNEKLVNAYIKSKIGPEFSAKDFRTWVGTVTAAGALYRKGPPRGPLTQEELKALKLEVAVDASEALGNNPETARDNYIDPRIFTAYQSGRLTKIFDSTPNSDRPVAERATLQLLSE